MIDKHLDIGCGGTPRNPYSAKEVHGLDLKLRDNTDYGDAIMHEGDAVLKGFPFDDNFFDSISAYDFIDHIPRLIYIDGHLTFPFIKFMSEVNRILKPGGKFYSVTPFFPAEKAFVDPTHVNFITKNTYKYFCVPDLWAQMYGFAGTFTKVEVKKVNFYLEVTPPKNLVKRYLYKAFTEFYPKSKQHILWEFIKS